MTCAMEVLDASGHVTLWWDPDDPESVQKAEAEFQRMQDAGFAFFTDESPDAEPVSEMDDTVRARGDVEGRFVQQTRTFKPRARRTVAVRQMRGG